MEQGSNFTETKWSQRFTPCKNGPHTGFFYSIYPVFELNEEV